MNRIWVQNINDEETTTWCQDKINDDDVGYIREDAILPALGFRDHEIGIINDICEKESLSIIALFRQSIRKFQGADDISMTLDDYKQSIIEG
jgi:hypothetical protein